MTESTPQLKPWENALRELEAQLELPAVPGELVSWLDAVLLTLREAGPVVQEHVRRHHDAQLAEIQEHDAALTPRVERMRAEQEEILGELAQLERTATALRDHAQRIEPAEAELDEQREAFVQQGTQWVIRLRRQEQAVTTWYVEALERDRGTVD